MKQEVSAGGLLDGRGEIKFGQHFTMKDPSLIQLDTQSTESRTDQQWTKTKRKTLFNENEPQSQNI